MDVKRFASDVGTEDRFDGFPSSDVPNKDGLVPTSRDKDIVIFLVILNALDSVRMAWLSSTASFKLSHKLPCLLIINRDALIVSC